MTEQEKIKKALSGLRASGDTLTEVFKMTTGMRNETSRGKRFTGKRAAIVIAAAVLALALGAGALAYGGVIGSWSGGSSMAGRLYLAAHGGAGAQGRRLRAGAARGI